MRILQADWHPAVTISALYLSRQRRHKLKNQVESQSYDLVNACERNDLGYAPFTTRIHGLLVSSVRRQSYEGNKPVSLKGTDPCQNS
jgi:hypothetical protein